MHYRFIRLYWVPIVAFIILSSARFLTPFLYRVYSHDQYLSLHTILEFITIFFAFSIFSMIWLLHDAINEDVGNFLLVVGIFLLAAGVIDLFHTLSYNGMPTFFTPSSTQKATFLWLWGRLVVGAAFLPAFYSWRLGDHRQTLIVTLLALSVVLILLSLLISTLWLDRLPLLVAEGKGVTQFKKNIEYLIIAIMTLNTFLLLKNWRHFSQSVLVNIANFFVMTIISEAAFTFYISIYDTYNLLGHIYKVIAYYFLYRAFYLAGIVRYFSNLNEIAALAEEAMEHSDTLKGVLKIYVEKLARIIPRAGQIAIFLPAGQENCYYLALCQGQFCQSILEHQNICLQHFLEIMGRELKILKWPVKTLKGSELLDVINGQDDFWEQVVEMLYLPLRRQDINSGFIWLLNFNKNQGFTIEDIDIIRTVAKLITLSVIQARHNEIINRLSYEDQLTGLGNRRYFIQELKKAIYDSRRYGHDFTLVFVDMNDLKYINDNYGHLAGDTALQALAAALRQSLRQSDICARLGGDEFGIILKYVGLSEASSKGEKLRQELATIELPGYKWSFSAAVGWATFPKEAKDIDGLMHLADKRMYAHKNNKHPGRPCPS